jgi:hypothetical protein
MFFTIFTFSTMTSEIDEKVIKAVKLFRLAPAAGTSFSYVDAFEYVGLKRDVAKTDDYRLKFNFLHDSIHQRDGLATPFDHSDAGKLTRALDIMGGNVCCRHFEWALVVVVKSST